MTSRFNADESADGGVRRERVVQGSHSRLAHACTLGMRILQDTHSFFVNASTLGERQEWVSGILLGVGNSSLHERLPGFRLSSEDISPFRRIIETTLRETPTVRCGMSMDRSCKGRGSHQR